VIGAEAAGTVIAVGADVSMKPGQVVALFGAGVASFLAPCIVPLLPAYLGIIAGEAADARDPARAVPATLIFVLGFALVFAGLGAAAQFEVPLTFRHEALRITFLTAHKARDAETVDWSTLTDEKMTVVVYMGMTAAPSVRAGLLAAGRSPQTPVGVFARVTRPDAQAAVGTLDRLPGLIEQIDSGPAILIIGDVVAHSAPWRHQNLNQVLSELLDAAE